MIYLLIFFFYLFIQDNRNDYFCWLCHKEGTLICCELCPRVYHTKCLGLGSELPQDWVCPECEVCTDINMGPDKVIVELI